MTMIPNLLPLGIVFGLISWCGIPVDIGTMISASVGLGLAVDGTMHFLTWFREGIRSGLSRNEAIAKAMGHCAPAMWQTAAVVGIGMLMLYPTELLLVSRFGWLMAALTLVAVAADLILLPAMLAGTLGRLLENLVRKEKQRGSTKSDATVAPPHFDPLARRLERVVQRR
jgi:predicted RND superfamily exporter protein